MAMHFSREAPTDATAAFAVAEGAAEGIVTPLGRVDSAAGGPS